jgi:hypothetical protein
MRPTTRRLAAFGVAAAVAVGLFALPALAQADDTDDPADTVSGSAATTEDDVAEGYPLRDRDRDRLHAHRTEELAAYLADEFAVDEHDVQAALGRFHEERHAELEHLREQAREQRGAPARERVREQADAPVREHAGGPARDGRDPGPRGHGRGAGHGTCLDDATSDDA